MTHWSMTARLRHVAVLAAALALCAGAVRAEDGDTTQRGNRLAYEASIKCFVANAHASGMRERAGDAAKAQYYDAKAHQSFDAASKLGAIIGLPGAQVTEDFQRIQARELPPLVADQHYFLQTAATCKALGLM